MGSGRRDLIEVRCPEGATERDIRRFMTLLRDSGQDQEVRRRASYLKPSAERRRRRALAAFRRSKGSA